MHKSKLIDKSCLFYCILTLGFLAMNIELTCQIKHIGIPYIRNYEKKEYKAATQSWGIVQDQRGLLYFANNNGILEYDGNNWNLYPVNNRTIVRSLAIDKNGTIWAGAFNEFGYLKVDSKGKFNYTSIIDKFPDKYRDFGDVWKVYPTKTGIYIQSFVALFYYNFKKVEIIEGYKDYQFSFYVNNRFFIQERNNGLYELKGAKLFPVNGGSVFKNKVEIWAMLPITANSILIATQQHGLFLFDGTYVKKFDSPIDKFLIDNQIFSAQKLKPGLLAFGTIQAGLIITNIKGEIIQHIDKSKGLQNNTILCLFEDSNHQLWLGLDNGIDYVEISSSFSYLNDGCGVYGTGYACKLYKDYLYLGTNQGLYRKSWNENQNNKYNGKQFELVENTKGQVWKLDIYNEVLLCGQNQGTSEIIGNKAEQISKENGGWMYVYPKDNNDFLIGGTYSSLTLYNKTTNNRWKFLKRIDGLHESSRGIVFDSYNNYWMSHGSKGVYRFNLTEKYDSLLNLRLYNSKNGLPSNIDNFVYKIGNQTLVCSESGIYEYNYDKDKFEKSIYFNSLFGENNKIRRPILDSKNNIWFYKNDQPCVLLNKKAGYQLVESIFNKFEQTSINSFENIEIINDSNIIIGTEQGFVHFNANFSDTISADFQTLIRLVKVTRPVDSVIFYGNYLNQFSHAKDSKFEIPFKNNAIKFIYVAPFYEDVDKNQFRYKLKGLDNNWSEWQSQTEKEYTNLPPGTFHFIVQSKNILGKIGKEAEFKFIVLPPWYKTIWSYVGYIIILGFLIYLGVNYLIWRIQNERQKFRQKQLENLKAKEELFTKEALLAEQKIIKLKNEKLEAEVAMKKSEMELKNKELASIAIQITHKNEILSKLKSNIDHISYKVNEQAQRELKLLINAIDQDLKLDEDWEQFTKHFEDVHSDFFSRLRTNYEDLTPKDLKLCAYLRMNLSTKEIAPLLSISVRGVEISRYRLRKKLGIEKDANLIDYMLNI